jgi:hypothetical protein
VEPVTTETPSIKNSLFSVRLPSIESCEVLRPPWLVMSPPEETPGVRARRFRTLRLGRGRSCNCDGVMVLPSEELSVASWPSVRLHDYGLGHFAHLQGEWGGPPRVHRQLDAGDLLALEAGGRHRDVVAAGGQIGRTIDPGQIGFARPRGDARIGIGDGNGGFRDGCGRPGDRSGNDAGYPLGAHERVQKNAKDEGELHYLTASSRLQMSSCNGFYVVII